MNAQSNVVAKIIPYIVLVIVVGTAGIALMLKPDEAIILTFRSGIPEMSRQHVAIQLDQPGQYTILLANDNPPWSGHWLIWDYLALKAGDIPIWEIGDAEAPPDYSDKAFSEFCDPQPSRDCETEFTVGSTNVADFSKDLNDGLFPEARINFTLTEQQVGSNLTLILSTTNQSADDFKMKVTFSGGTLQ